jgi:hypothetical protein
MNRRDFLKRAGAVAIVPAAIPGAIWGSNPEGPSVTPEPTAPGVAWSITAVVYDERYTDCTLFADALIRQGAVGFPTNGDSAQLWYGLLGAHLSERAGRVAGLTTYADFSISQACGRERNLSAMYEGAHDGRRSKNSLKHRLRTMGDAGALSRAFARAEAGWPESVANALSHLPQVGDLATGNLATAITPRSPSNPGYLTSWLLVPRSFTSQVL